MTSRIALHHDIVTGNAPYQYRYRVLVPYAAEVLARGIQYLPVASARPTEPPLAYSKRAFVAAYCLLNLAALVTLLWSLGELIWRLFRYELALVGVALSAALVGFTFRNHHYQPWSFWEGALFALGLLLLHRKQYWRFSAVGLLGLVNRETSVFLLLAFLFTALPSKLSIENIAATWRSREMRFAVGNLVVWVLGFFVLHRLVGYRPSTFFLETAWKGNQEQLVLALELNVLVFGLALPLAWRGWRLSPPLIRRAAMVLPGYFGLLLVIGYWWEIRYWITAIPIVVPALIAAFASANDGEVP